MAEKTPRPPLFPLALLLLALVAASALRPGRGEGAGALNGVYLVAPGGTPLDRAQLRAQGIRIVTTAAALRDAAATAEIVIVDREALPLVGDEWLARDRT